MTEQQTCSIREAALRLGVSGKKVRRLLKAGRLRAELQQGRWGPEYRIETSSLPPSPAGVQGRQERLTIGRDSWPPGFNLSELLAKWEGALVRVGQLEGERERRLALESQAESLRAKAARADILSGEVRRLSLHRLLLLAALVALAAALAMAATWR